MAALSLRGTADPVRIARALEVRGQALAEFFVSEVLEQQSAEVTGFMLDTSVLGELTADMCVAVTGRPDAAALLHAVAAAHLFLVPVDDEQASFRYHHLVRRLLRAELRARDQGREQKLQLRAAEWLEAAGDARRAARHFLAAGQADRALTLLEDRVVPGFPGPQIPQAQRELWPLGQLPRRGVGEDLLAARRVQRVGLPVQVLGCAGDPGVADTLAGERAHGKVHEPDHAPKPSPVTQVSGH